MRLPLLLSTFFFLLSACQAAPQPKVYASGEVIFQDTFSNPESGWTTFSNDKGSSNYMLNGLRLVVNQSGFDLWSTPSLQLGNVRVEVDAAKLSGAEDNRVGLLCRFQDSQNYYFFVISTDGFYGMGKVKNGKMSLMADKEMQSASAIQHGMAPNHLRADCVGNILSFYINGELIDAVKDNDFQSGDVGLLAGAFDQGGIDILFDNFVVVSP